MNKATVNHSVLHSALRSFAILMLVAGCATTYEPHLVLPSASLNRSIDATVELHSLVASDELVLGQHTYGVLAEDFTNPPPSKLTEALTEEIWTELSAHQVFRTVSPYEPEPDLLLTGRIDQFFEHDRRKPWTYVPYYSDQLAGLFRLNSYKRTGEVRLTLILLRPTGARVGTYTGHVQFQEDYTPHSELRPGDRLNRAFGQALAQIRDEMLSDPDLPKGAKVTNRSRAIK
jgi:hypothetical protein